MKALLWLPLLAGACAWADEAADRAAISRVIGALNETPQRAELFTADADGRSVPDQLRGKRLLYRVRWPAGNPMPSSPSDHPTVTISHEVWGEAAINFPGVDSITFEEMVNPRIVSGAMRFITPDVALANGACRYNGDSAATQSTPLLFVMKREGGDWKIASLRVLAQR
jgi:hypothetical protein